MEDQTRRFVPSSVVHLSRRLGAASLVIFLLLSTGCRSKCDLVEAELRGKESQLRETREELDRQHAYTGALQRELNALRGDPIYKLSPEEASQTYTLRNITLGRQTGGYNEDNLPGDEALQVVLEPHDGDGHTIKAPGMLSVKVLEVNAEGLKKPLCTWRIPPETLRKTWKSGLWTNGYFVVLPWKDYPDQEKLRVIAQFVLADGRSFEADKDINVHIVPTEHRKSVHPDQSVPAEIFPPEYELPPPRPTTGPLLDGVKATPYQSPQTWGDTPANALIRAVELRKPVRLP
jgi:hypothetical protein